MISYRENSLAPTIMSTIRRAVGWSAFSESQLHRAMKATAYSVVAYDGTTPVGMARLIGDGIYFLLCDVAVIPEAQGNGIGSELVQRVISHVQQARSNHERCTITLVSAEGNEPFYESFGFISIPHAHTGHGMQLTLAP